MTFCTGVTSDLVLSAALCPHAAKDTRAMQTTAFIAINN
jgi:hypothetical protein